MNLKYLDKVLRSNSYEELMWVFKQAESSAKEITESYAAFSNMKKVCKINDYQWLHIGDGTWARTAALFSFFSKAPENISIDPNLRIAILEKWMDKYNVRNLILRKDRFQNVNILPIGLKQNITCVHAHVKLEEVDECFPNWTYLYTNPCCYPGQQTFSEKYMKQHNIKKIVDIEDEKILTVMNQVIIYQKFK